MGTAAPTPRAGTGPAATRLRIDAADLCKGLPRGASVAVNGVCLTLVETQGTIAAFDVVPETLRLTNLGDVHAGDGVNLERSLRVGDRIDGHFVQGHVDEIGVLDRIDRAGDDYKLWIRHTPKIAPYVVRKGSITLDGVSLTVVDALGDLFSVVIIPTTWQRTTLGRRSAGARLNIETDVLMRAIVARLDAVLGARADASPRHEAITVEKLRESGFIA